MIWFFLVEKPTIVHSNTPKSSLLAMIASWITGVRIRIYTVTGLRFETENGFRRTLLMAAEKLTCLLASKVIPEGEGVKKTLIKERITNKPLTVINNGNVNGIDLDYYKPEAVFEDQKQLNLFKKSLGIRREDFVFCFVGRMVKSKGIQEIISSFVRLTDYLLLDTTSNPSPVLLLVGPMGIGNDSIGGDLEDEIRNNRAIKYVGRQDDIRPFILVSNVFVFPSYREGFPNVVMQAGAMGVPCIVSDISGCNEIIVRDENGLIIPPKDINSLYEAMLLLYKDHTLRNRLASKSRQMIVDRYDQRELWAALLKEYQNLIKQRLQE
jgi:glycosyltransferase involved in cell wall biosynthesis